MLSYFNHVHTHRAPYKAADVVRIRTGEVGADAERMVGGRSDMRGT